MSSYLTNNWSKKEIEYLKYYVRLTCILNLDSTKAINSCLTFLQLLGMYDHLRQIKIEIEAALRIVYYLHLQEHTNTKDPR